MKLDLIWVAVIAFAAYELGRSSELKAVIANTPGEIAARATAAAAAKTPAAGAAVNAQGSSAFSA